MAQYILRSWAALMSYVTELRYWAALLSCVAELNCSAELSCFAELNCSAELNCGADLSCVVKRSCSAALTWPTEMNLWAELRYWHWAEFNGWVFCENCIEFLRAVIDWEFSVLFQCWLKSEDINLHRSIAFVSNLEFHDQISIHQVLVANQFLSWARKSFGKPLRGRSRLPC